MTLNRTRTSYPVLLTKKLEAVKTEYESISTPLLFHQYVVRSMFTDSSFGLGEPNQSRGLLLYHETGTGKTIAAASILVSLIDLREPVLLIKKSLQANFIKDLRKITDSKEFDNIKQRLKFITADAFNSGVQIRSGMGSLDGKLLIVDEAHNFFKSIINASSEEANARIIYDMIMKSKDVRIVFLSGTPIDKIPFELVPIINMLTGMETLPGNIELFNRMYVGQDNKIANKNKLQNRLMGLVSYMPASGNKELEFPNNLGIKVVEVPMSNKQYAQYMSARENEEKKKSESAMRRKGKERPINYMSANTGSIGTYYVESRQISNFSISLEYKEIPRMELGEEFFNNDSSPKIVKMVNTIKKSKGPCVVYSEFINAGLDIVKRYLMKEGYSEWKGYQSGTEFKPRFVEFTGKITPETRASYIEDFNRSDNKYGELISVILISAAGAEGLDLKCVREVHILEPYWDWSRIKQIQARGIRNKSHVLLPPEDQNVQTYIYCSVPPKEGEQFNEKRTIDVKLLKQAMDHNNLNKHFLKALQEVSIECLLNDRENCRKCLPDNVPLYDLKDSQVDIDKEDPCKEFKSDKVKAEIIEYEGVKYNYVKDNEHPLGYNIYKYNEELKGYEQIPSNDKLYINIIEQLNTK